MKESMLPVALLGNLLRDAEVIRVPINKPEELVYELINLGKIK